jgi:hypothetical protein
MPDQPGDKRPHFVLANTSESKPFTAQSPGGGGSESPPELLRSQHGAILQSQLLALRPIAMSVVAQQTALDLESGLGLQIHFASQPGIELAFESLANEPKKIELLSV